MIAIETTLHKKPNATEINSYRSPYNLLQLAKLIPHSPPLFSQPGPQFCNSMRHFEGTNTVTCQNIGKKSLKMIYHWFQEIWNTNRINR